MITLAPTEFKTAKTAHPQRCDFRRAFEHRKGEIYFKGTRLPLRIVLAAFSECNCIHEVQAHYPTLTTEHVEALEAAIRELCQERDGFSSMSKFLAESK